ncbi:hypothetical protein DIPPA_06874 [Diplonema papillatum]|nr:hypothetical protein DIPPA_06874 [Diplonema papillatum]
MQNLLGQLHGQLTRSADKKVQYPDEEGSLYSVALPPRKSVVGGPHRDGPKDARPCSRIRIACQLPRPWASTSTCSPWFRDL